MQRRHQSLIETLASTAIGLVISILLSLAVYPAFGHSFTLAQNVGITVIFTAASIARGYVVRRAFNRLHSRTPRLSWPTLSQ